MVRGSMMVAAGLALLAGGAAGAQGVGEPARAPVVSSDTMLVATATTDAGPMGTAATPVAVGGGAAATTATTATSTTSAGAPGATAPVTVRAVRTGGLRLEASLSTRRIVVRQDGEVLAEYPVAVGKPDYRTPTGSFTIRRLIWNPGWVPPASPWARGKTAREPGDPANPMKVVKLFFQEPDYYIHGTNAIASLGSAASHGCLRMSPAAVAELARMIMTHGGVARDDGWFTEVLGSDTTHEVTLDVPVQLVVVK